MPSKVWIIPSRSCIFRPLRTLLNDLCEAEQKPITSTEDQKEVKTVYITKFLARGTAIEEEFTGESTEGKAAVADSWHSDFGPVLRRKRGGGQDLRERPNQSLSRSFQRS